MLDTRNTDPDGSFPHLALALDPVSAGSAFGRVLGAMGYPAAALETSLERVRLKPGRKALFGYRLRGRDACGKSFDQRLMLTQWPLGDRAQLPDLGGDAAASPAFGPPRMELDELGGEAWFFPNDRKIRHIAHLLAAAKEMGGEPEVVHYVPEQGCTIRCEIEGKVRFGKVRADDRGSVSVRVYHAAAPALGEGLRLAPILSHDPLTRIQWQESVAGRPVGIEEIALDPALWADRLATALRAFHALPVPEGLKCLDQPSVCRTVLGRIERTLPAMPEHARRLSAISCRLNSLCLGDPPLRLSHGDLHPANLLWDGKDFALIDLDTCALAPAALDQGSLVAAIAAKAIQAGWKTAHVGVLIDAFAAAFSKNSGEAAQFEWFLTASLIGERLYRSATRLKSSASGARLALLELAEARLDLLEQRHAR
jgi:Phosphotransferase enzyme family